MEVVGILRTSRAFFVLISLPELQAMIPFPIPCPPEGAPTSWLSITLHGQPSQILPPEIHKFAMLQLPHGEIGVVCTQLCMVLCQGSLWVPRVKHIEIPLRLSGVWALDSGLCIYI